MFPDALHVRPFRMKTELLIQMDGLARGSELVFVLAATNMPWELDMAMLRRLEKRIMVPLPNAEARKGMFQVFGLLAGGTCSSCPAKMPFTLFWGRT